MLRTRLSFLQIISLCAAFSVCNFGLVAAQTLPAEWRFYGGDQAGTRYASSKQIDRSNVAGLRRAWTYHTGELELGLRTASFQASFSCTPLVVDGVMYLSTPSSRVIALDAETGQELWKFDPQDGKPKREFNSNRGVAYWEGRAADGKTIDRRILFGTVDGRLIALNAETGHPCPDFGKSGLIDLRIGFADKWKQDFSWGARVTAYLIASDRENMTAEQRRESLQREKYYKKMLRKHFLPFLLPALSPFYDPAEKRPPEGLEAFMARVEVEYGAAH